MSRDGSVGSMDRFGGITAAEAAEAYEISRPMLAATGFSVGRSAVDELVAFVLKQLVARERQLDEDEGYARQAFAEHNNAIAEWHVPTTGIVEIGPCEDDILTYDGPVSYHIARWDPARVLAEVKIGRAEVEAKRRIVTMYENARTAVDAGSLVQYTRGQDTGAASVLEDAVRLLAQPYAGISGWREEWAA